MPQPPTWRRQGLIGSVLKETYRVERRIGSGGMGSVYEVLHLRFGRHFAAKVLSPTVLNSPKALARFRQEALVTSKLGNPHIVQVFDFDHMEDRTPYIIMELLRGEDLAARLERDGQLPLAQVTHIFQQAASALHDAHEQGIIHRDLKPQNIFLCQRDGQQDYVKLVDFGISKVLGASSAVTGTHELLGSPAFMSPEQAMVKASGVDLTADIFTMGSILYMMLTGDPPFMADAVPNLLYMIVHEPPEPLCERCPELPRALEAVLDRAMRKDRAQRYRSMEQFWQDFSRAARQGEGDREQAPLRSPWEQLETEVQGPSDMCEETLVELQLPDEISPEETWLDPTDPGPPPRHDETLVVDQQQEDEEPTQLNLQQTQERPPRAEVHLPLHQVDTMIKEVPAQVPLSAQSTAVLDLSRTAKMRPAAATQQAEPLVRLRGLCKSFGAVRAVDRVDLELRAGEVHGVLGENGAGKTSLMCLLAGLYLPDAGAIELEGAAVSFGNPRQAMAAGVGMVHQHFMLVPTLTVAENVLLGAEQMPALLRPRQLQQQVQQRAEQLGLTVDAGARVADLSVGQQQRVEILRVLSRGARVMIMDEPTAVLSPNESEALMVSLGRLAEQGHAVVLISHKLQEVRRVSHRVTVMRRGAVVARHDDPAQVSDQQLAEQMVGRSLSLRLDRRQVEPGPALLRTQGLRARSDRGVEVLRGVDLELRAGEILGLAGVAGNGQVELMEVLAGVRRAAGGAAWLDGDDLRALRPIQRIRRGLRYVPEDRNHTGTAPSLSVAENLLLRRYRYPPCRRGPWLRLGALNELCQQQVQALQISAAGLDQSVRLLSGGNLQKVILAREVCDEARLILAMHPTRGLDVWATTEVRRLLLAVRERQAGVLLCSEDLEELLALSDRVAVIFDGRIVAVLERGAADLVTVGRLMTGGGEHQEQRAENREQRMLERGR